MTMTNGGDQTAQLTVLGTGRLPQPAGGPRAGLLEVFPNRFPHRPYVVSMAFPEYTSLCPVTGQPDFGTIVVEFIPRSEVRGIQELQAVYVRLPQPPVLYGKHHQHHP